MDYSTFKGLFALLIFGSVIGVGIWQLLAIKQVRRQDRETLEEHGRE